MASVPTITLGTVVHINDHIKPTKYPHTKILNTLIITGELSDKIVDDFIKKLQEKDSFKLKEEKCVPPSECKATTLKTSKSQEKINVSESWNNT